MKDELATAEVLFSLALREAQIVAGEIAEPARSSFARELCASVLRAFWQRRAAAAACRWDMRTPPVELLKGFPGLTTRFAESLLSVPFAEAGYLLGQLYTTLLPPELRKTLGAYYTPPLLVQRLVDMVEAAGFDWSQETVIDPACGGAAFLASVAPRLAGSRGRRPPLDALEDIETRLAGIEIDPFASWMSMVLLDLALLDLAVAAKRPLKMLVLQKDALQLPFASLPQYGLVIGNPPYGKVSLPSSQREKFGQTLFGHANLYGLFTELAVRLAKPGGVIAYVTPTSFLGGEYFKRLRRFLSLQAPLRRLDFVSDREGVFEGVLQETMLAVFRRLPGTSFESVEIHHIRADEAAEQLTTERVGTAPVEDLGEGPWLLPRVAAQVPMLRLLGAMSHRLKDYGFEVATGQLVWNRHKEQLRSGDSAGCYPIIWAEAVGTDGRFHFQAARRGHLPYIAVKPNQDFLLNHEPCVLVQRTTAKEQRRRLVAAVVPNSFVVEYPGYVVENHLNMVCASSKKPRIALHTIAALLNSPALDQVFRCINGSVAVSAYELNSLPLPAPDRMHQVQDLVLSGAPACEIDALISTLYNQNGTTTVISTVDPGRHHRQVAA